MRCGKPSRVTNGHRAAVCGLMLAGVPYVMACQVVGISRKRIRPYIPNDWLRLPRRAPDWTPKQRRMYRKLQPFLGSHRAAAEVHGSP